MIERGKHNVLGIRVSAVDYDAAISQIMSAAKDRRPLAVSALAVHGLMTGVLDPCHRFRLNDFDLLVPDGQPVRWALNWLHRAKLRDRVYGPDLMLAVCRQAAEECHPVFLFGGTRELLSTLSRKLTKQFPLLQIAGVQPSKFRRVNQSERDETIAEIRESGAAITFVGLGCPRQEVWAYESRRPLSMPVLAVGAAFNFHAGELPQAPGFMQSKGLEWLYRLSKEPRRLWKRYLLLNPLYASLLLLQLTGLRQFNKHLGVAPIEEVLYG